MDHEHTEQYPHDRDAAGPGYETRDTDARAVIGFGVGIVIAVIVVQALLLAVYRVLERKPGPEPEAHAPVDLYEQLHALRQGEDETLSSYGWVDRKGGVVRIPIERALDLVADRGVPRGKGPKTLAELNSHSGTAAANVAKEQAEALEKQKGSDKVQDKDKDKDKDKDGEKEKAKGRESRKGAEK